ncbi:MAG: hypothetical protein U9N38_00315 [Thermodesulfobacteriota bacterium]|nr:hypothetical protein [Thermodesulfobacteriota bacterium]
MAIEKRVIDGVETEVNVETVDGKETVTPVKKESPKKEVSQEAIDRIWKTMKDNEEKSDKEIKDLQDQLKTSEEGKVDLVDRIKGLEAPPPKDGEERIVAYGQQKNGTFVYPQTEAEWDNLISERPSFGSDLRAQYKKDVGGRAEAIATAQKQSALNVAKTILPDMYKKDSEGKLELDINGRPVPDESGNLYKIFCQVAAEEGVDAQGNPIIFATKNGPELIALKVKQVLGTDRETELKKKAEDEKAAAEAQRDQRIKDGKTAPPGHSAPAITKAEVKFSSDYEKETAERKVAAGVYKSLEEYCSIRDDKVIPYGRGGF